MYGLKNKLPCEWEYEMSDEPLLAALFTTGNGYMGVRGSFEEFGSLRIQGAFVRGYIDEIIEVCEPFADNDYMKHYYLDEEKLKTFERQESGINLPDFLLFRVKIGEKTFFPWEGRIVQWERSLDPSTGELCRRVVWDDGAGNLTELIFRRFASFADQHLYCQSVEVRPLGHELPVSIISGVDTAVKTGGQFVTQVESYAREGDDLFLSFRTTSKYRFGAAYAVKNVLPAGTRESYEENGRKGILVRCERAERYRAEKFVAIVTERDRADYAEEARRMLALLQPSYGRQFALHCETYGAYFAPMDIRIGGDDEADGWLRFANYHTAISAPLYDWIHGAAAKGLTGERYNQFVWWDCEIHQLPFFLHTAPETAKNLLMYRYERLAQSEKNAEGLGLKGAKFAFCSSVTGEERVWVYARHPFMQVHIVSDVAYGVIHYYDCTADDEFMKRYGLEMLVACARYWASRAVKRGDRYVILQVTGTDEHHPYVDNDAYTNYCVQYTLFRTLELCKAFGYSLGADEAAIRDLAEKLYLPMEENGLIPQFDGYFSLSRGLEEAGKGTLKQFQMKKSGLYQKSQIIKQPDVVLLYTMVNVGLSREHFEENWDYYEAMCETSSSLTFPVHAIASARCSRMLSFEKYFMETLKIDVEDIHGVGWQGVHSGCLAGGYLAVLYGLFGLEEHGEKLVFRPAPPVYERVEMTLCHRGRRLFLVRTRQGLELSLQTGEPIAVRVVTKKGEHSLTLKDSVFFREGE